MKKYSYLALLCAILATTLPLAACEDTKQKLGLVPQAPDEFTVVHRAPLSMPPDFTLRPPRPGAPSPQDEQTAEEAQAAITGGKTVNTHVTPGAAAILQATGAQQADPNIRPEVDAESTRAAPTQKPVAQRVLGWTGLGGNSGQPAANVVDPEKEAARLQHDQSTGQAPTAGGPTPSVEN